MRRLSLAIAALVCLSACRRTTEVLPTPDVFVLSSVDGRPLPTTRSSNPSSNGALIVHEELLLDAQGVATRNTTVQGANPSTLVTSTVTYAFTRNGDVITLGNVLCGPGALCIQHVPEEGSIIGVTLTLMPVPSLGSTGGSVLVYQRAGSVE